MNTLNRLNLLARMESSAANHPQMFNTSALPYLYAEHDDGFARAIARIAFRSTEAVPFFDVEGAEANLYLTLARFRQRHGHPSDTRAPELHTAADGPARRRPDAAAHGDAVSVP